MSSSHFPSRHRKDLSTEMIRTKIAHRKSLSQKENRHKEYERNRHFGLKDVNIPTLESRLLVELDETSQELVPEKANIKPSEQRKQMLQKYKEEKQLQRLKEQREKAKREIFKVGLYRPDKPWLFTSNQTAEPKKAVTPSVRITRSKAKDQIEHSKVENRSNVRAIQPGQRQTSEKKLLDKETKVMHPIVPTLVRTTRSATQAAKQNARTVSSNTMRKPTTTDNASERKAPNKGRPTKKIETKSDKVVSFKIDSEENTWNSQTSTTNGVFSNTERLPTTNPTKTKGKNSFAPSDFMFQPLDGLKSYQVAPMTPRSANAFLTPTYIWSPLKTEVEKTQEATKEILTQKSTKTVQDSNKLHCSLGSLTVLNEEHGLSQNEDTTKNSNGLSRKEISSLEINESQASLPQHDVPYFRNILQLETEKLTSHCLEWDRKLELDIPDDAKDLILTAVGQTRLLIKERFKQFEELVNDCEYKRGEKETTCTDLDGFWDMIGFQIEDVKQKFNNLTKLEDSGWQNNYNTNKKVIRKKPVSSIASKPKQDDGGRLAARNRLAAIKNAMREKIKQEEHAKATGTAIGKEVDKIVFDAGFFRVESPVRSFSAHSDRLSQRRGTPKPVSEAVHGSTADVDPQKQTKLSENPDPQRTRSEHVDELLFSNIPGSRNSIVEDAQCPGLQGLIEINHDVNKINLEMDCLPGEKVSLPLLAGGVADDITTNKKEISEVIETMELNSSVTSQDVSMNSPEKNMPTQNNALQEEAKTSQSVLFDNKSLATECCLLDSPGLCYSNQMAKRHQEHARHISFGGNLIAFSPLRPLSGEQLEEF